MPSKYYSELEGVRGYAFLLVFATHYLLWMLKDGPLWTYPLQVILDITWVCVPIFFVLSGFLITGVLLRSKGREGYFKIFYARRTIRVFPLYYSILLVVGCVALWRHAEAPYYWSKFLYAQNLFARFIASVHFGRFTIDTGHFWSLAVEEQFYLVWPVAIWFCNSKKSLLRVCYLGIAMAFAVRFCAPYLQISPALAYGSTLTRIDAVLFG